MSTVLSCYGDSAIPQRRHGRHLQRQKPKRARKVCPAFLWTLARRKLEWLDAGGALNDLRLPPSNQLEALKRDRIGQHSIRLNSQYRICFVWTSAGPDDVEIVDHHPETKPL